PPPYQDRREGGIHFHICHFGRKVYPGCGPVSMDVPLHLRTEKPCPVEGLKWILDIAPVSPADRKQNLLAEDAEVPEVQHACISPSLQLFHGICTIHPWFGIRYHDPGRQKFPKLGPREQPLLH